MAASADHQSAAFDLEPYEKILKSRAYERMRSEHSAEYAPASVFFTHDERSAIDRRNSFRVKAALVHEAITGHHVDDPTLRSNRLLLALANACHSAISQQKHPTGNNGTTKNKEVSKEKDEKGGVDETKNEDAKKQNKDEQDGDDKTKNEDASKQNKDGKGGADGKDDKGGADGTKNEDANKQDKDEKDGTDGKKNEDASKQNKDEKGGADGTKDEDTNKQDKDEKDGTDGKKNEDASKQNKDEKGGANGVKKTESRKAEEKAAELTDETWDADRKRVVDGIFLVVGFLPKLMDAIGKSDDRDGVDNTFKSRHMHDIVTDIIKIENQLPLQVLIDVADAVKNARVIDTTLEREFKDVEASIDAKHKLAPITADSFADVVHKFCWYYSPFFSTKKPKALPASETDGVKGVATGDKTASAPTAADGDKGAAATDRDDKPVAPRTLLDCLHQSVLPSPPGRGERVKGRPSRMPAARDLKRSGIRIQASETGRAEIRFTDQFATLRLPALVYDFKLATVARNLLAREYEEQSKPVTRYFQMMNEMVEDLVDVRILRRAGVVRAVVSVVVHEVYLLIKNIDGHATYPSVYMAMDREIENVKKHHEMRMNKFFVRNRPGVIWASSVAAISVVAIVAARKMRG